MSLILDISIVIIEFIALTIIFNYAFKFKKFSVLSFLGALIPFLILCFTSTFHLNSNANLIISIICYTTFCFFSFEDKATKKIAVVVIYYVCYIISQMATLLILSQLFDDTYSDILNTDFSLILAACSTTILTLCLAFPMIKVFIKKQRNLPIKYWILIILYPLVTILIVVIIDAILMKSQFTNYALLVIPYIGLVYINVAIFDLFETYSAQLKYGIAQKTIEHYNKNYTLLKENEKEIRRLKHDIRKHLDIVYSLVKNGDTDTALTHLSDIKNKNYSDTFVVYTQNQTIDSIINIEIKKAKLKNINFKIDMELGHDITVSSSNITTILFNILDNAIEAADKSEAKEVSLHIHSDAGMIKFIVKNSTVKGLLFDPNNCKTDKENSSEHGYGIKSVKKAVKDMNGIIKYSNENDNVIVFISIPQKLSDSEEN